MRISINGSAKLYNSTIPLLVLTTRMSCSRATYAPTEFPQAKLFFVLIQSTCFKPLLLKEYETRCPSECKTNSNLKERRSYKCFNFMFFGVMWLWIGGTFSRSLGKTPFSKEYDNWELSKLA